MRLIIAVQSVLDLVDVNAAREVGLVGENEKILHILASTFDIELDLFVGR